MEYSEELQKLIERFPFFDTLDDQHKELLEMVEMAFNEGIEYVLKYPYKHELVPMDSARDWVADNYAPRY